VHQTRKSSSCSGLIWRLFNLTEWDFYKTGRWQRPHRMQLRRHPLCKFCLERGIFCSAAIGIADVEPHINVVSSSPKAPGISVKNASVRHSSRQPPSRARL
jgi:hypothetical protein